MRPWHHYLAALVVLSGGALVPVATADAAGYTTQATGGAPVRVCLIDSGVPEGVPGVVERLTATGSTDAADPHGVQMVTIIRNAYPAAQVVSVQKVDGRATTTSTAEVVDLCVSHATSVILASFTLAPGGFDRPALQAAVGRARAAGVVLVAAAGNDGHVSAPANLGGVVGVGAIGADGKPCAFSASGGGLVMAPGCDVEGTPTDGTSDAAAYVAGTAAALAGTRGLSGSTLEQATRRARYTPTAGPAAFAEEEADPAMAPSGGAYLWVARPTSRRLTVALRGPRAGAPTVRVRGRAVGRRLMTVRGAGRRLSATVRCPGRRPSPLHLRRPAVGAGRAVALPRCAAYRVK